MIERITSQKLAAIGWLLLVIMLIIAGIKQGPAFDSSIMALLPKSDQQPLVQQAVDKMAERFSKRLVVLISGESEADVRAAIKTLSVDLTALPDVDNVVWQVESSALDRLKTELYPYRFSVLDEKVRQLLLDGHYQQVKDRALARLFSPMSPGKNSIIDDPFGLFSELTLNRHSDLNIKPSHSLLKVTGVEQPTYMLMATLAGEPFSTELQNNVLGVIRTAEKRLVKAGMSIRQSGLLLHAAAGAQQAKSEMSTIGLGSLTGIILIMLLIFRQLKSLLIAFLPLLIGCACATAVTLLVFGKVHLITLAFGAGLVGVSIDYALHFLCERRVTDSKRILRKILPGLLLGLFSSVMAYAAQALAPFPGLQQMATFSVAGLVASWITVVLWFPLLTRTDTLKPLLAAEKLNIFRHRFPRLQGNWLLIILLLIPLVFAVKTLWGSQSLDDIRLLQTSPASLLSQEQDVQQILGVSSSSQFLLISGDTLQACLQKEEQLAGELESLKKAGLLDDYQALSLALPSLKRQQDNIGLAQKLYEQQLAPYFTLLKVPGSGLSDANVQFKEDMSRRLTAATWQQQQGSESWKDLIIDDSDSASATAIRFTGALNDEVKQRLLSISNKHSGVTYIDQVQNISDLMGRYRSEVVNWVIMAYLFVLLVLVLRYKVQVWRVVMPPLLASVLTLAMLVQLEQGLNLFHMMALILVLGIGLDMGIFLIETGEVPHTWLAVSLSTVTSLLAFGLLALSDTPVLHHFGLTVLIGLALVWLLASIMRKNNSGDVNS